MGDASNKKNKSLSFIKVSLIAAPVIMVILALSMLHSSPVSNKPALGQDLMAVISPNNVDVSNAITDKFVNSTQSFAIELFKDSITMGENSLISPTSVFLALGMTANGANGETLNSFEEILGKYNMTLDELNKGYKAYADELTKKRGSTTLNIANSIWFRDDFTPNPDFLQNNADYFGAGARKLNFNDAGSADMINNWVKENTNDKIDKVIDTLNPDDVMHLINTLYFKAKWKKPFDTEQKSSQENFYLSNGQTQTSTFMYLTDTVDYMSVPAASAVLLPYDDGRFAFLGILPDKSTTLDEYIMTMDARTIPDLISLKRSTNIAVTLPKFTASEDIELMNVLNNMGLGIAFDGSKADFSKMGKAGESLVISSVKHKTFLQVDELGTEAGAVTDAAIRATGINTSLQTIVFNRPFIYAVVDTQTNLPLFFGTMESPQS